MERERGRERERERERESGVAWSARREKESRLFLVRFSVGGLNKYASRCF